MRVIKSRRRGKANYKVSNIDWDPETEIVAAVINFNKNTVSLTYSTDAARNNIHLILIKNDRIPMVIKRVSSWRNLADSMLTYTNRVTDESAQTEIFKSLGHDEIIVDWINGWYYCKVGPVRVKRFSIEKYYIIDEDKMS